MDATPQTPAPEQTADATRNGNQLFRYAAWVHLGHGAAECEQRETGDCPDPDHFHAWCRLVNALQLEDIRERALAAKARRLRQLRDPTSDVSVVLDTDLGELRRDRQAMLDEAISKDWWRRQLEAQADLAEREEYKHIDRDRERLDELNRLPADQRPADEYAELERHVADHNRDLIARKEELEKPVREAIEALDELQLLEQLREERIRSESTRAFMDEYSRWQWLAGTFTTEHGSQRRFTQLSQLDDLAPEVIEALRDTFNDLEGALNRGPQGN